MKFQGNLGILVLGIKVLSVNPKAALSFMIEKNEEPTDMEYSLWEKSVQEILSATKFGRIGIFLDRKNFLAHQYFQAFDYQKTPYKPKGKRSEKCPRVTVFTFQVLRAMALEGLADTVEFRRLGRRFIRQAKNANCDTIFFPELIFGETKTKKILQHIAGKRIKVYTSDDFFVPIVENGDLGDVSILSKGEDPFFLKKRSEQILHQKLSDNAFMATT